VREASHEIPGRQASIVIDGDKTSFGLEEVSWNSLKEIARERGESAAQLIAHIEANRQFANLSSAIRLFVLEFYREKLERGLLRLDPERHTCT
jgi:predicted DNA-binding ribbon-helix-helix protein